MPNTNEVLVDNYIDLLIDGFRKNKHIPYAIKTKLCPDKNSRCRKRHGEIIVSSYDNATESFHILYYSVHNPKPVFEYDQQEQIVHQMIKKSTTRDRHQNSCFLPVEQLKKLIFWDDKKMDQTVKLRMSKQEKKLVSRLAKQKEMKVSAYIRSRLFT